MTGPRALVLAGLALLCGPALGAAQAGAQAGEAAPGTRVRLRAELVAAPEGSERHREALRSLFDLELGSGSPAGADSLLDRFATRYGRRHPRAAAEMTVELSRAWARAGDAGRAAAAAERPELRREAGARALLDGRRAELALQDGDSGRARELLRGAAAVEVDAALRARWIALLGALEFAAEEEARAFGAALREVERRPGAVEGSSLLEPLSEAAASPARPALLGLLAGALDRAERARVAAEVRRHLVDRHPETPEAAEALLALARGAVADEDPAAARRWLERLVLAHPDSPSAPEARRLLARLDGAGS